MNGYGKREPGTRMVRDRAGGIEISEEPEVADPAKKATAAQMARRKIAQPKGRKGPTGISGGHNRFPSSSSTSSTSFSTFSSTNGPTTDQNPFAVQPTSSQIANPFAIPGTSTNNPFSFSASNPSTGPIFSFGSSSTQGGAPPSDSAPATSSTASATSGPSSIFNFSATGQQLTTNPFAIGSSSASVGGTASDTTPFKFQFGATAQPSTPQLPFSASSDNPFASLSGQTAAPATTFQFSATPNTLETVDSPAKTSAELLSKSDQTTQSTFDNRNNSAAPLFNFDNKNQQNSSLIFSTSAPSTSTPPPSSGSPFKFNLGTPSAFSSQPAASAEPASAQSTAASPFKFSLGPSTGSGTAPASSAVPTDSTTTTSPFKFVFGQTPASTSAPADTAPATGQPAAPKQPFAFGAAPVTPASAQKASEQTPFKFGQASSASEASIKSMSASSTSSPIFNFGQTKQSASVAPESTSTDKPTPHTQTQFNLAVQQPQPTSPSASKSPLLNFGEQPATSAFTEVQSETSLSNESQALLQSACDRLNQQYLPAGFSATVEEVRAVMDPAKFPAKMADWSNEQYFEMIKDLQLQRLNHQYFMAIQRLESEKEPGTTADYTALAPVYASWRAFIEDLPDIYRDPFGKVFGKKAQQSHPGDDGKPDGGSGRGGFGPNGSDLGGPSQKSGKDDGKSPSSQKPNPGESHAFNVTGGPITFHFSSAQRTSGSETANKVQDLLNKQNDQVQSGDGSKSTLSTGAETPGNPFTMSLNSQFGQSTGGFRPSDQGFSGGFKPNSSVGVGGPANPFTLSLNSQFGPSTGGFQPGATLDSRARSKRGADKLDEDETDQPAHRTKKAKNHAETPAESTPKPAPFSFPQVQPSTISTPGVNTPSIAINAASPLSRTPSPAFSTSGRSSVLNEPHDASINPGNIFAHLASQRFDTAKDDTKDRDDDEEPESPPKPTSDAQQPKLSFWQRVSREPSVEPASTPKASNLFASTIGVGDHTWKPTSPIKFGAPASSATASAATTSTASFQNLFGLPKTDNSSTSGPAPATTVTGFTFAPNQTAGSSLFNTPTTLASGTPAFPSSLTSADVSRANSPGHGASSSQQQTSVQGAEQYTEEQADLIGRNAIQKEYRIESEWSDIKSYKFVNNKQWKSQGTGVLMLLNKENKLSLMLRKPNGYEVLNTRLLVEFPYEQVRSKSSGELTNRVQFVAAEQDGFSPWLLVFADEEEAEDFAAGLATLQEAMIPSDDEDDEDAEEGEATEDAEEGEATEDAEEGDTEEHPIQLSDGNDGTSDDVSKVTEESEEL